MPEEPKLIANVLNPDTGYLMAYSMGAKHQVRVLKASLHISKNGRPRLSGICSETGCKVSKFLPMFPKLVADITE